MDVAAVNRSRITLLLLSALGVLAVAVSLLVGQRTAPLASDAAVPRAEVTPRIAAYVPPIHHVFVINIENKGYDATWGAASKAPYLARTLRRRGVLLNSYYGTAHNSQPNYIAQISGQGPNPDMQGDCQLYSDVVPLGAAAPGQVRGAVGCIFGKSVPTLPGQLDARHLTWRGYMQGMVGSCVHPAVGGVDNTQKATATSEYATRHDPFMYFHSIIDRPRYCQQHVVPLRRMAKDLASVRTTRNLTYITPDLCGDGHDAPCADGRAGGLRSVNVFMKKFVPLILASPAYQKDGLLIITADESDSPQSDATACCGETAVNTPKAGITGDGGGRIGALVLSRWTRASSWSTTPYNHYSLLASLEEIFRLGKLGYARTTEYRFGLDVYNNGWQLR